MKGTVTIFNAVKGLGFIEGEDGKRYFFHQTDLAVPGFRAIAVGKEVEFTATTKDGRPVAKGIHPTNGTGVQVADPLPKGIMISKDGIIILRMETMDTLHAHEDLWPFGKFVVEPSVWATDGSFRAFRVGGMVRAFALELPAPTSGKIFLALDGDKEIMPSEEKIHIPGSYILSLENTGSVRIQSIGRRYQSEKGGGSWVVLEMRFQQNLNLKEDVMDQISSSGLERDNDGFISAIEEAVAFLERGVTAS